jgi:SGF29 tudor-like domain
MNARTAKKIKQELEGGIQFCVLLHDTIRSIIQQIDPSIPPIDPLSSSSFANRAGNQLKSGAIMSTLPPTTSATIPIQNGSAAVTKLGTSHKLVTSNTNTVNIATTMKTQNYPPPQSPTSKSHGTISSSSSHMSPSNTPGSTLRRHRRTKIPPSGEVLIQLPEVDELTGKRHSAKKGHPHRLSDVIRFRAFRQGDPVAARVTSRDLWILARVVKDYPGTNLTPIEFLRLSDSRREQIFKEKVLIQDVEEHDGGAAAAILVSRSLVLPLPRNVSEAAEWGNFYRFFKKGSRVYAMYPQTTALYTATVVDCTTYCRRDEDIVVVEFDGDDPDPVTGKLPACHIPARFVTLIPKEFPGAHAPTATGTSSCSNIATTSSSKRKRNSPVVNSVDADIMNGVLDDLNFDGDLPGLDQFDDLDFDLLGDG